MNEFGEGEYQGRDPKGMTAEVDVAVVIFKIIVQLFLIVLMINLLADNFS